MKVVPTYLYYLPAATLYTCCRMTNNIYSTLERYWYRQLMRVKELFYLSTIKTIWVKLINIPRFVHIQNFIHFISHFQPITIANNSYLFFRVYSLGITEQLGKNQSKQSNLIKTMENNDFTFYAKIAPIKYFVILLLSNELMYSTQTDL